MTPTPRAHARPSFRGAASLAAVTITAMRTPSARLECPRELLLHRRLDQPGQARHALFNLCRREIAAREPELVLATRAQVEVPHRCPDDLVVQRGLLEQGVIS